MTEPDKASQAISLAGELLDVAKESPKMRKTADSLAGTALVLAQTLETLLLPLAAINAGRRRAVDYFEMKFPSRLDEVTSHIPAENIQEPKPYIAAPLMNGLAYAVEEEELEELFLRLLGSAMDDRVANDVHPSFVQILKELSPEETKPLLMLLTGNLTHAAVQLRRKSSETKGSAEMLSLLTEQTAQNPVISLTEAKRNAAWNQNWQRLGLIDIAVDMWLSAEGSYDWAENHLLITTMKTTIESNGREFEIKRALVKVTDFGQQFAKSIAADRALAKHQSKA